MKVKRLIDTRRMSRLWSQSGKGLIGKSSEGFVIGYPRLPMIHEIAEFEDSGISKFIRALIYRVQKKEYTPIENNFDKYDTIVKELTTKILNLKDISQETKIKITDFFHKLCYEVIKVFPFETADAGIESSRNNTLKEMNVFKILQRHISDESLRKFKEIAVFPNNPEDNYELGKSESITETYIDWMTPDVIKIIKTYYDTEDTQRKDLLLHLQTDFTGICYDLGKRDLFEHTLSLKEGTIMQKIECIVSILRLCLSIIEIFHQKCEIVHCDIKLDNILVMSDNSFKITDFGFSSKADTFHPDIHRLTLYNSIVSLLHYWRTPEEKRFELTSEKVDEIRFERKNIFKKQFQWFLNKYAIDLDDIWLIVIGVGFEKFSIEKEKISTIHNRNSSEILKELGYRSDIYSIGMMLIYSLIHLDFDKESPIPKIVIDIARKCILVSTINNFYSNWQKSLSMVFIDTIIKLIRVASGRRSVVFRKHTRKQKQKQKKRKSHKKNV
jgi:serine/threonine protein kinase